MHTVFYQLFFNWVLFWSQYFKPMISGNLDNRLVNLIIAEILETEHMHGTY